MTLGSEAEDRPWLGGYFMLRNSSTALSRSPECGHKRLHAAPSEGVECHAESHANVGGGG